MFVRRGLRSATDCTNTATWRVRTSSLNTERRTGESSASRLWRPNSPVSRSTEGRSRQSRRILGRRVCGSDFQGIGEPFKRNCPSGSAASPLDLNVSAGDPHRVARDCLPSGRPPASLGPDVAANATRSAAAAVDIVFTAAGATANYPRIGDATSTRATTSAAFITTVWARLSVEQLNHPARRI